MKPKTGSRKVAIGIVLAVAVLVLWAMRDELGPDPPRITHTTVQPMKGATLRPWEDQPVSRPAPEPPITMSEFRRVQTGMSYSAVVDVLGELGEEMSRTSVPGLPTTIMYGWQNPDGSNMNAMFQGGSLIQKAQFGLR
ncbi:MAG: hypothetical protein OXC11_01315 [Rhodospirillales bacterium]|nr:hypothetical protein [Rhodospirillales bacterium]